MKRASVLAWVALGVALSAPACSSEEPGASAPGPAEDAGPPPSALAQTCARGPKRAGPADACNGSPALCDRTYDQVVVPMTHNAMSNADEGWGIPNQTHGIARQLADGVRGMMLDLHYFDTEANANADAHLPGVSAADQVYLCHTSCLFGRLRLLDGLCALVGFLDANPGEVVSVIFESHVSDADAAEVIEASGLAEYAYVHADGAPWPTLREMIDAGKRAVLFVETGGGDPPFLQPAYDGNVWDTPYSFETQADFTCALGRGVANSPLYLVNHWLSRPLSDVAYAREVNVAAVLGARVERCTTEAGRKPTFVAVDFYDVGDLFDVVRAANGL